MMTSRRPIRSRETTWAKMIARWLTKRRIKPNSISLCSLLFAMCAAGCLVTSAFTQGLEHSLILVSAAVFVILRLLCNLFDGMVAIEGGAATKTGDIFNDFPDRPADIFILLGCGYAAGIIPCAITLGWLAALLAVLTAYIRLLGQSMGTKPYFVGPMAKPQRMAVIISTAIIAAFTNPIYSPWLFLIALIFIILGSMITIFRRLHYIIKELESCHAVKN